MATLPPAVVARLPNSALSPIAAVKVVAPVVWMVNDLAATPLAELMVPPKLTLPLPVLMMTLSVNSKSAPPITTSVLVVLICPAAEIWLGAVAVKPPVNTKVSVAASPKVKVPV